MSTRDVIAEEKIIKLLEQYKSLDIDQIVDSLYQTEKISERRVKEAILYMRYTGKIIVNRMWEMTLP